MGVLILLFIGFVFGVVFSQSSKRGSIKPIITIAAIGLVIGLLFSMIRIVPAGYVGVVDLFGRVSAQPLASGLNLVNPLARVHYMSVRTEENKEVMAVPSKEGLTINLDISVLVKLDPSKAVEIYRTVGPNYRDVILTPQFRAAARSVTVAHEAKALYTSERETLALAVQKAMEGLVVDRGIVVEAVLLRAVTLPPTVSQAIEQKLRAEQDAERMKFIVQREEMEAQRKRVEAEGIRDAQAIINASLTERYLQYLWTNTLNDNPNVIYVATESNLPMFRVMDEHQLNKEKQSSRRVAEEVAAASASRP